MMKLATGFSCVAVVICVFYQSVEAALGVSSILVATIFFAFGAGCFLWGLFRNAWGARAYSFDDRATEGGFLN